MPAHAWHRGAPPMVAQGWPMHTMAHAWQHGAPPIAAQGWPMHTMAHAWQHGAPPMASHLGHHGAPPMACESMQPGWPAPSSAADQMAPCGYASTMQPAGDGTLLASSHAQLSAAGYVQCQHQHHHQFSEPPAMGAQPQPAWGPWIVGPPGQHDGDLGWQTGPSQPPPPWLPPPWPQQ
jgi:hypothetical protein